MLFFIFKAKYRRKLVKIINLVVVLSVVKWLIIGTSSTECIGNCTNGLTAEISENFCNSNRSAKCQFCSGKVR